MYQTHESAIQFLQFCEYTLVFNIYLSKEFSSMVLISPIIQTQIGLSNFHNNNSTYNELLLSTINEFNRTL